MRTVTKELMLEMLESVGVQVTDTEVITNSGDLGVLCNPFTNYPEFIGHSIYSIAKYYAELTGKKFTYINDRWD